MSALTSPRAVDVAALRRADDPVAALDAILADDVEWIEIDQRSQPHAPSVVHGRVNVTAGLRAAHARGLVSRISDGFATAERAAFTVTCTYPTGEQVACNALADLSAGKITRWVGVQAWDE